MPATMTHISGVGDGAGTGSVGSGAGDGCGTGVGSGLGSGAGALPGAGSGDDVGAGRAFPTDAGCSGAGDAASPARTRTLCAAGADGLGREGAVPWLGAAGGPAADGPCPCGVVVRNTPAADAPTTVAVAAAPQATGRILTAWPTCRSIVRAPRNTAIPAVGRPARHPDRREARTAVRTADRWRVASSVDDT
jgi:hypothetical protein